MDSVWKTAIIACRQGDIFYLFTVEMGLEYPLVNKHIANVPGNKFANLVQTYVPPQGRMVEADGFGNRQ